MDNTILSSVYPSHVPIAIAISSSIPTRSEISEKHSSSFQQSDRVSLSQESISKNIQKEAEETDKEPEGRVVDDSTEISSEELREIQTLQRRDAEVKAHEQAHLAAAGQYAAGGASYSYKTGPNGKRYATGGEVPIDLSKEQDPQATLVKMTQVRRAALAPATPSGADRNIAARASMIAAEAMRELNSTAGKNIDNENSPPNTHQDDSSAQAKISGTLVDNQTSPNSEASIPQHTRHMVLQAYAAHSQDC